jgi:hypothetical protein
VNIKSLYIYILAGLLIYLSVYTSTNLEATMRFTNPIHYVALVAAIIPATYAIKFTFWVPMQASQLTNYDKIISGTKATENKFELTYEERYVASNPGNRRCFNETNALYGQPGVAMMSDSTGNCENRQHYESIAYISLSGPSEESQPLNINMEGYSLLVSY